MCHYAAERTINLTSRLGRNTAISAGQKIWAWISLARTPDDHSFRANMRSVNTKASTMRTLQSLGWVPISSLAPLDEYKMRNRPPLATDRQGMESLQIRTTDGAAAWVSVATCCSSRVDASC